MSKKKPIISIIIIVIAITIAFIFWRNSPEQREKRKMMHGISIMKQHVRQLIEKADKRKFLISGTVVDQNGKLLRGVNVRIVTKLTFGIMPSRGYTNENKVINGRFKIEANGGSTMRLAFTKSGYFAARKEYIGIKEKNITFDGNIMSAKKQTIILRKIGKLANLKSRKRTFYFDFESKEQDIMDLISFNKVKIKNPKDIKTPKYFYLSVMLDKHGKPEMVLDRHQKLIPKKIFLNYISNDKTDGIIPVNDAKDMRDLPTAPEKAYTLKQITLKILRAKIFFYYKNGDTYGKVWVQQTDFILGKVRSVILVKQNNEKDPKEKLNLRSMKR